MSTSGLMKVLPHTLPSTLHVQNQTAFDWGWQNLVAYGSQALVVVVDPKTVQCLQTLTSHKSNVIKVCWARDRHHHHSVSTPYRLRLASVDAGSSCIIWDVTLGTVAAEFSLGNKPLIDLQWLETNDTCRDLLAVMLNPGVMTIWNADTGTKVSRFTFTETIMSFSFNPFQPENLILQSTDCFIFVSDFNPSRTPTGGGKKFYLSTGNGNTPPLPGLKKLPLRFRQRLVSGEELKGEEILPLQDCLQVAFSPACHHQLFLLYSWEIIIMDTDTKQTVGTIPAERNASPFQHIMPCQQRDVLYCLHENGCVSVRMRQHVALPSSVPTSPLAPQRQEVCYDLHGHSETLRISKTCQVYAGALCPTSETCVAVLTSEGRILFWGVEFQWAGQYGRADSDEHPAMVTAHPVKGAGLVMVGEEEGVARETELRGLCLSDTISPHWFVPPDGSTSVYGLLSIKMLLSNLWVGLPSTPTCVRMCPPLTTKNWLFYAPLVAVGTSNGSLLVYNLHSRVMLKVLSIHCCPVRGVEWTTQFSFITYAYSNPNLSGNVRNEVAAVNIQTGNVTHLVRPDSSEQDYSTPIDSIKISTHKYYLVIKYKDKPLEFWDLKTLTFLREMVSNPPSFNCIEWSPSAHKSKSKADTLASGSAAMSTVDFDVAMGATDSKMSQALTREHLTVMDVTGSMWQIVIEGSKVKVAHSTPVQTYLNGPTCVAWKNELMAAGDADGMLFFHDNRLNHTRSIETPRAVIKKLRFAPGKGNSKLFVLYNTRLDIRDTQQDSVLSQLKWGPKEAGGGLPVEDVDWATSDQPLVVTSDGAMRIYNISLQQCQSNFTLADFKIPVFCPHSIPPAASLKLKHTLIHQPWNVDYSLSPADHDGDDSTDVDAGFKVQLGLLPEEYCDGLLDAPLATPERALMVARLCGDQCEVEFWSVALYYLLREKNRMKDPRYNVYMTSQPRNPISDIIRPNSDASISIGSSRGGRSCEDLLGPISSDLGVESDGESFPSPSALEPSPSTSDCTGKDMSTLIREADLVTSETIPPLDLCWDLLCDVETFQKVQLHRVLLHDAKRVNYQQTRKCSETLLLLGQTDRAVQLLLETDSSSHNYYTDALKACLAATIRSSGASQSTIKLVATNLIANARLMEGAQLLCLIDKQQDACRYLQTYGEWYYSVWLAKATLQERDYTDVFCKWAEHLAAVGINQKNRALSVLLSVSHFYKILEMLYSMRCFDQAAVFAECCLEYGVLQRSKETTPLFHAIFLEYARYLLSLGLERGFRHYCNEAGDKGQQLLQQYFKHGNSVLTRASTQTMVDLTRASTQTLVDLAWGVGDL